LSTTTEEWSATVDLGMVQQGDRPTTGMF